MQHAEDIISQLDQRITTSGSETKELQVRIGRQHEITQMHGGCHSLRGARMAHETPNSINGINGRGP